MLFSINCNLVSQVTIGSSIKPNKGAFLDLKETEASSVDVNDMSSITNSTKGLLFPKVSLKSYDKLTPLFGGRNDGLGNWSDESTEQEKATSTGMVVFNTNGDAVNLNQGMYVWVMNEWIKLSSDQGNSIISVTDCEDIVVNGSYVIGVNLNESNYIDMNVNVTKKGVYSITINSNNGYSFYGSGVFVETGEMHLRILGQGTPTRAGTDNLTMTGMNTSCNIEIEVQEYISDYSLVCGTAVVAGDYYKNDVLNANNKILINVNVKGLGSYNIYTETKNGIKFSAKGIFTSIGTQQVVLLGDGIPTVNEDFDISITTDSENESAISCNVTIPVTLPAMTYAVIGTGVWSWAADARQLALSSTSGSFSPTGIVKIKSLNQLWSTDSSSAAQGYLNNGTSTGYPDVILYFAYGTNPTQELTDALANYINAGGCLLYASSDNTAPYVQLLMNSIFGSGTVNVTNQTAGPDDNVYMIKYDNSNPIINGPFGNLSGQYWGEDNTSAYSIVMTNLPPNSTQISSAVTTTNTSLNPGTSIIWYNQNKHFVYFGDSTGASTSDNSTDSYPSYYSVTGTPRSKLYGPGGTYNRYIYNSALELNSLHYLLKKALTDGINSY